MKKLTKQTHHSTKHTGAGQEPDRVASRLEGVVKNKGIKPNKKAKHNKNISSH